MDYKESLNMPVTDFEMRGNLAKKEPLIEEQWEKMDLYNQVLKQHEGERSYVLHDGPPYANGNLHAGTAMNRVIKDFINRSHWMNHYQAKFFPGWDTHGLPIENAIQKLGVDRKSMPAAEFRKKCEEYAHQQIATQMATMKRLGTLADFDHPYITLKKEFEARQIEAFSKMALDGLIFQGAKPIYWSPYNETAVADSEIVYFDRTDTTIFVAFDVKDGKGVLNGDEKFVIWTTTPWTIPADTAVCLNPAFTYVCVQTEKGKLIMLDTLADSLLEKFGLTNQGVVATYKGQQLEFVTCVHPLYEDRESVVILGQHVTDEDGTGCVHTAGGHGLDDFYATQKYGIPPYCPVDAKGCMMEDTGERLAGKFVFDANPVVVQWLEEKGSLLRQEPITHSYPHDERLKKPVIFRCTTQWFCSIEKIREKLLGQIKAVKWENEWGEERLYNMIRDRGDWCISRQRLWGVPIPIIYNEDDSPIMEKEVFDHIAELFREFGSNVWFEREAKDLLPEGYTNPASPNGAFTKEKDIMDVWFDSGSSHQELEARGYNYPADLYFEGSDQYRGWFNSSLIVGTAIHGVAPYKSVLSHGYVCDDKGEKMSKSVGNVVNPMDIINTNGADVLRLWCSTIDFKQDVRIGKEILKQVSDQYRKVRNTFRFLLGNVNPNDFTRANYVKYEDRAPVDQYICVLLDKLNTACIDSYMRYNYLEVSSSLTTFMNNELSAFYLDYAKDILYCEAKDSPRRRAVQSTVYDCLDTLNRLWAPILAYTTEEVYRYYDHEDLASIHLNSFADAKNYANAEELKAKFDRLMEIRSDVNKAIELIRNEKIIGKSLEADVTLEVSDADAALFAELLKDEVEKFFIVSFVTLAKSADENVKVTVTKAEGTVCPRCWNLTKNADENGLCPRCHSVVEG